MRIRLACLMAAALVLPVLPASAQSSKASAYEPPRAPDGKPDLNGIWEVKAKIDPDLEARKGVIVDPPNGKIPYLPAALAKKKENAKNRAADPVAKCYMPGVPRLMYIPHPFQIVQIPGFVAILSEYAHVVRNIHIGDKPHLPDIEFWLGDSRGHWDGDTLVVDVADFNDQTWFDQAGDYHSDALHVVERYTRTGPETITYEATIEDPMVFSKPWKITFPLSLHTAKNAQILEYECFADKEGPTVTAGTKPDPDHAK
jgi:hypothetical protein